MPSINQLVKGKLQTGTIFELSEQGAKIVNVEGALASVFLEAPRPANFKPGEGLIYQGPNEDKRRRIRFWQVEHYCLRREAEPSARIFIPPDSDIFSGIRG